MSSKRPHTKSRLGCKQCKKRRVKCDERPPCCGNCTQKGLECDFQEYAAVFGRINVLTPTTFLNGRPGEEVVLASQRKPVHAQSPEPRQQSPASAFSMQDLGLLHHFTLHTSGTIGAIDSELYNHIWRQEVPRLAQSHSFLMHAVLGFAAAHQLACSNTDPLSTDYSSVRNHYSKALTLFRESVEMIDQERAEALLCFSILTSFLTLYLECGTPAQGSDPLQGLATFLTVVQNSARVLQELWETLRTSTVGVLLSHTWYEQPHAIDPETEHSLYVLDCLSCTYIASISPVENSNEASLLVDALAKLRKLFALVDPKEKGWALILRWPISLDSGFITLLKDGNPIALCALAHWCVPIYHAPTKWFTGDWPKRMLMAVEQRLRGTQWAEGMRWPLSETIGHTAAGTGRPMSLC